MAISTISPRAGNKRFVRLCCFNQENASGAFKAAEILGVSPHIANDVLSDFTGVEGRTIVININGSQIIIGKTDNPNATAAVLNEAKMDVIIVGTPRKHEKWRLNILKEVVNAKPSIVALFPGLDCTTNAAEEIMRAENYEEDIRILKDVSGVIDFAVNCTEKYQNIFIGGNGQEKIEYIQRALKKIAEEEKL